MIWRRVGALLRRSRHFDRILPILDLAWASFVALFRYSWKDFEILIAYLYRLQQYQNETNIILARAPIGVLNAMNQQTEAAKAATSAILSDIFGWLSIWRTPDVDREAGDARVFGRVRKSLWRVPNWLRRSVRRPLVCGVKSANVATMHSFAREAIYGLLSRHGDLGGAQVGFEMLDKLRSRPDSANAALDRVMLRLIPFLQQVENRIAQVEISQEDRHALVIRAAVWGDDQVDLFLRCALPSLLTPGNLPGLVKDVDIVWHVFTTAQSRTKMAQHPAFAAPYSAHFEIIPDDIIELAKGDDRCWLDGGLTHMSFKLADRLGADIHLLKPNTIYSDNYFTGLYKIIKTKNPNIVLANSFRTDRDTIVGVLDTIRASDDTISLDARSLYSLGLNHIHQSSRSIVVTDKDLTSTSIPQSTMYMWRSDASIAVRSTHYQPIFISDVVVRRGLRFSYLLDDNEFYRKFEHLAGVTFSAYFVRPEDDVGYLEIGSSTMSSVNKIDREKYILEFWKANTGSEFDLLGKAFNLPISQWPAELPNSSAPVTDLAFDQLYEEIGQSRPEQGSLESQTGASITIADLVGRSDTVYDLEVRKGCSVMTETWIEDLRSAVREGPTFYEAAAIDDAYLSRLYINFLRLGLLEELKVLCARHKFRLRGATKLLNTVVNLCGHHFKHAAEAGQAWSTSHPSGDKFTLSCTVWGNEYVRNFMNFNVRSMLAPGNLPALAKLGTCKLFVVTNENGRAAIEAHPVFAQASKYAEWEFAVVPQAVITELVSPAMEKYFYVLYGMLDHIGIFFAQGAGSSLFMIPVDAIVADGSFMNMANYRSQGFECCGGGNIVANSETFLPALEKKFSGETAIVISTEDLASLAIEHAHHYFVSQVISAENHDFGMHARELFWPVPGGVEIHSCFIHPLFVAASALARYKLKHYANVDYGMIPRIFNEPDRIKIVTNTDEAYINNFATRKRRFETTGSPFEYDVFLRAHAYTYPVQKALFIHRQTLRCRYKGITANRDLTADIDALTKGLQAGRLTP